MVRSMSCRPDHYAKYRNSGLKGSVESDEGGNPGFDGDGAADVAAVDEVETGAGNGDIGIVVGEDDHNLIAGIGIGLGDDFKS